MYSSRGAALALVSTIVLINLKSQVKVLLPVLMRQIVLMRQMLRVLQLYRPLMIKTMSAMQTKREKTNWRP